MARPLPDDQPQRRHDLQEERLDGRASGRGQAGEIATGKVDDTSGAVTEAWTGPQVAWKMARGSTGAFGGRKINSLPRLARLLRALPARPRRPAAAAEPAQPRPARAALVLGLALVLQPRRRLHERAARLSAACSTCSARMRLDRVARAPRHRASSPVWPVWVLAAATVFLGGFRIGLNVRDSNVIDVGYSGVDRRRADRERPVAVRQLPGRGRPEGVRAGRRRRRDPRAHPDERPLRVGQPARRHVRAGRLRGLPARLR